MKKQIIFDMDGVLFDTENLVFSCWKFAAGKFMLTGIEDVFYQVIGVSSEGTKKVFSKTYGDKLDYAQFREETHRMFDEKIEKNGVPLKTGARELLQFLKINGWRVGLASSTRVQRVEEMLKATNLYDFFEVIVGGDMIEKSKPEPDIYLNVCEKMKINPKDTYAIEDSHNGVRSAAAAGLRVLHVPDMLKRVSCEKCLNKKSSCKYAGGFLYPILIFIKLQTAYHRKMVPASTLYQQSFPTHRLVHVSLPLR